MKKNHIYLMLLFLLPFLAGCEDENKAVLDLSQSTPAAITSPAAGTSFELLAENAAELIVLDFDPAVFQLDVATDYTLEWSATEDFATPLLLESTIDAMDGMASFSVVNWNKALLAKDYEPMVEAPAYFRLITRIIDSEVRTYSNVLDVKVTPYKIASDGSTDDDGTRIYIVGAGVPDAGWDPSSAIEMINIAPNVYRATATFANDRFRFLGQMDWNPVAYNWPFFTGYVSGMLESALQPDREDGDGNLWFKGTPGSYVITVDLDKKTIVIDAPFSDDGTKIYIVGAGVPDAGWDPTAAIEMNNIAPNVYRATATFANDRFRFLGQQDWNPIAYNWPYFTGEVSDMLESALQPDREDGDGNIWFKGTPGSYTITVNLDAKWITIY